MSKKLYEESNIEDIADAIREKNGTQNSYTVAQMGSAVRAIETQPDLEVLNATENGNYLPSAGKDGFSEVNVNVESGEAVVQPLSVSQNGTYNPPSGVDGFAPVTVNVPSYVIDKIGYSDVTFSNTETDSNIGDPITNKITTGLTAKWTQQVICTSNAVDLTDKQVIIFVADNLRVNTNSSGGLVFGVSQSIPSSFSDAVSNATAIARCGNRESSTYQTAISVGELTGNYYIYYAASLNYGTYGYIDATFEILLM